MDEAGRIIADLRRKLDELNYKVVQYRHDMCSEFEKYTQDILCTVTQDVSSKVTKAIAISLKDYPALNPELQNATTTFEDQQSSEKVLPIPSTTSNTNIVTQDEPPRSPHEREREFTGVFTPSYLPLLDSTDRHERRSSEDMSKAQPLKAGKTHDPNSPVMQPAIVGDSSTPTVILQRPPTPQRKNTDSSSINSNGSDSDSALRKSALRRSSSSASHNILSPRKVRFALEGQEYPTDSIPQPPTIEEEPPKRNAIILGYYNNDSDDDEEAGSEQVENVEEPPPKRISSSQALRALSRGPLEEDDGTKWTVVAAPPDGSASVPVGEVIKDGKAYIDADDDDDNRIEEDVTMDTGAETYYSKNKKLEKLSQAEFDESHQREVSLKDRNKNSASAPHPTSSIPFQSSEQPKMNGMPSAHPQTVLEPSQSLQTPTVKASPAPKRKQSTFSLGDSESETESEAEQNPQDDDEDDDDMFEFEDSTENRNTKENDFDGVKKNADTSRFSPSDVLSPRSVSGFRQADTNYPGAGGSSLRSEGLGQQVPGVSGSYGTSGSASKSSEQVVVGTPSGIDYSYKGNLSKTRPHPFNQPIASDQAQREAEQMGDLKSWVGSVDGRSGIDDRPGDSGFIGSLGLGGGSLREGGQPRSFSERFMMEEEIEKSKAKAKK